MSSLHSRLQVLSSRLLMSERAKAEVELELERRTTEPAFPSNSSSSSSNSSSNSTGSRSGAAQVVRGMKDGVEFWRNQALQAQAQLQDLSSSRRAADTDASTARALSQQFGEELEGALAALTHERRMTGDLRAEKDSLAGQLAALQARREADKATQQRDEDLRQEALSLRHQLLGLERESHAALRSNGNNSIERPLQALPHVVVGARWTVWQRLGGEATRIEVS